MIIIKNASYSEKLRWNEIIVMILLILIIDNTPTNKNKNYDEIKWCSKLVIT